jgi:predicted nucleic acid-binding protein
VSRLVVVDASVVRAAGETQHPVSSACRNCLEAIRSICHRVAFTEPIRDEWVRHMSRFSRKWRRSMAARQKPITMVDPKQLELRWDAYSDVARAAIEKDRGLLGAALATDRVIITLDDSLRRALAECRDGEALLRNVRWIHPVTDGVAAIQAL